MTSANVSVDNPFLPQVERVRVELRERVARAHQVLQERETALLSELQQLEDTYRGEGVDKQINQLRITREQTLSTLTENENKETLEQCVAPLEARMRELADRVVTTRDGMREVELEWDEGLEDILRLTGLIRVRGVPDYKAKLQPVLVAGTHSEKTSTHGQFNQPRSITIHPKTHNLYICDSGNNRVQVFNESLEFLFTFSEHMKGPVGICISINKVYVTQLAAHNLAVYSTEGRYLQSVGREGKKELEFTYPRAVAVSIENELIYICDWINNRIQCLNLNLTFNSFISDVTYPRDIKLSPQDIVVLTEGSPCIQFYDYSHQLTREIITRGDANQVFDPGYISLDMECNILITDISAHCILIFSNGGELKHKLGKKGESRGELIEPRGAAVYYNGRVVAVSGNQNFCIQMF